MKHKETSQQQSGFRLHHKIAFLFILLFGVYTVVIVGVNIQIFRKSIIEQKKQELTFQTRQFATVLEKLSERSTAFMRAFLAENHLELALQTLSEQGPFYSRTGERDIPLNTFKKAILFEQQYAFLRSMIYSAKKEQFSDLELFLVSPHRTFADLPPEAAVQIYDNQVKLHLFQQVGSPRKVSYQASLHDVGLMDEETFLTEANRLKFSGFDSEVVREIMHESGFTEGDTRMRRKPLIDPFSQDMLFEKRYQDGGIILHFEHVLQGAIYNPDTEKNAPSALAVLVMERRIDKQWLLALQGTLGGDFAFFQNDSFLFSTLAQDDRGILRDSAGWVRVGQKDYLSVTAPEPFMQHEREGVFPAALIDADFIRLTTRKIMQTIGVIGFVLFLGIMLLSRIVVQRLVGRPIGNLVQAADQLSSGNFDIALPSRARDEVGFLSRTFTRMSCQLKASFEDIQQKQERLLTLEKAIESMQLGVTISDLSGNIIYTNPAEASMHGYHVDELLGQHVSIFAPPERRIPMTLEQLAVREGLHRESVNLHKDGATFPVWLTAETVKTPEGEIVAVVSSCEDITERKHAEEELRHYRERLEELVRERTAELSAANEQLRELSASKDKFFSIIAHDLRSPLAGLVGFIQLLGQKVDGYTPEDIKLEMHRLQTSSEHLYALLENLLTWSRLQSGAMEYAPEDVDVSEIIEDTMVLFGSNAEQKRITLTWINLQDVHVYADYNMVNTVIRNLVSNALKFTHAGGSIEIVSSDRETDIEIAISDTGTGISQEDLAKLFRIDVQYTNTGTSGEKGTGLGLNLCKDLVEKNGGTITVESELGRGSTFRIHLPKSVKSSSP